MDSLRLFAQKNTPKSPHNPRYLFPAKNWADILFKYRISAFLTEYSHLKVCSTISDQRTTSDRRIFAHKLAIESLIKNEEIQFGPFFNFDPGATLRFCPCTTTGLCGIAGRGLKELGQLQKVSKRRF